MDIDGFDDDAGKKAWMDNDAWKPTRKALETIMGSEDYLEQYFATNICFEPLVGELFRSGFIMQASASNRDFVTPAVVSAAEADFDRNLANCVDLIYLLVNDEKHGKHNTKLFNSWLKKHVALGRDAASSLQPIWSQPHGKPVQFTDAQAQFEDRLKTITSQLGLSLPK
jgi:propane monooxygenase small subunit